MMSGQLSFEKKGKRISQAKVLYIMVALLWMINLFALDLRRVFPPQIELLFHLISLLVFAFIYLKVSKWAR